MKFNDLIIVEKNDEILQGAILSFLSGYGKECSYDLLLIGVAMIYNSKIRKIASNANSRSTVDSLFLITNSTNEKRHLDLINIAGRIDAIKSSFNKALIKLSSKSWICMIKNIKLLKNFDYHRYSSKIIKDYLKASYYIGFVFSKQNEDEILTYIL